MDVHGEKTGLSGIPKRLHSVGHGSPPYFTLRSVLLYHGGAECQWTLRYVVLNYLYEETVPC